MRTTVLLADDNSILTESLAHFLGQHFEVVGIARDGLEMVTAAEHHRPHVIVAGISIPKLNGIDAARIVREVVRRTRILFLTMHNDPALIEQALRAGANGVVLKAGSAGEVLGAIKAVARGETYITPLIAGDLTSRLTKRSQEVSRRTQLTVRQRQLPRLVSQGRTMKDAVVVMGISARTAKSHK